jgi:hypothetical protein
MSDPTRVNVILHGVFGYVFKNQYILAYTPAVCGHIYKAGGIDYDHAADLTQRTCYTLIGVQGDPTARPQLSSKIHPALPLDAKASVDPYGLAFCTFQLPYPKDPKNNFLVFDRLQVGEIYGGRDAAPLNALISFPAVLVLVYERGFGTLALVDSGGRQPIDFSNLPANPGGQSVNIHIWCTIKPDDMAMSGMTPEGHVRKTFSGLMNLFPHEVCIEVPNRFSPNRCPDPPYPEGVTATDIDPANANPAPNDCSGMSLLVGKVNCHYSMLIFPPKS